MSREGCVYVCVSLNRRYCNVYIYRVFSSQTKKLAIILIFPFFFPTLFIQFPYKPFDSTFKVSTFAILLPAYLNPFKPLSVLTWTIVVTS